MHLLGRKPPGQEDDDPAMAVNNAVESDEEDNRDDEDEAVSGFTTIHIPFGPFFKRLAARTILRRPQKAQFL